MSMQGIDISSWQAGLDLAAVPHDFAIIKATQGTYYVNPECDGHVQQEIALGKCFGVYHYVGGGGATAEADFFVDNILGYIGHGILVIDWEAEDNAHFGDTGYLRELVTRVIARTGVKPLVYASASTFPWGVCEDLDCGAWVAQYGSMEPTGYQEEPWNEGAYPCAIRQYASSGTLPGWSGYLDLNKAYMGPHEWSLYAGGDGSAPEPAPAPAPEPAPSPTYSVYTVQPGDTLSGIAAAFGTTWQRLAEINVLADPDLIYPGQQIRTDGPAQVSSGRVYTVQPGDTLSGIAAQFGTSWQRLAEVNGIPNPDLIYPGQQIAIG